MSQAETSPSPSPSSRAPRPTAILTNHITHGLFNGGALDSQVTDSQYISNLAEQHTAAPASEDGNSGQGDGSFNSSGSSDTTYDPEEAYALWQSSHSQGDEFPKPRGLQADDPMGDPSCLDSRPSMPDVLARYADLNASQIRLSTTEARVIADMRADRDSEMRQWATNEQQWYVDMSRTHNQAARIAALESLLEYHRIPFPAE
ncbi:hypothetical protein MVEN_02373800 [Mycena venus]|uniref:Uncharacterized protein n=1 Tax=Mycena venus TaxID=2733690 RepID=A0A8H7CF12_9AGAR|nr:hypothetical protein MVEN_02373800 [Mycena venus]